MRRRTSLATAITLCLLLATAAATAADPQAPVAILYGSQRSYQEAATALRQALEAQGRKCLLVELPKTQDTATDQRIVQQLVEAKPGLIAASGATATSLALESVPTAPVVFFMVPNALDADFLNDSSPYRARVTGVAADVSPKDQIDWIVRLHPAGKRVGVLHSPRTKRTVEAIRVAGAERGVEVVAIEDDGTEFAKAVDTLLQKGCGSALMIPDAKIYNQTSIQHLLLWGIRQKKPVWTFSDSIVKSGAMAGLYCDTQAIGRQTAELVVKVLDGTPPSSLGVQYPRQFGRAVNDRTAEMIGLRLDESVIGRDTLRFGGQQ